jgi:hypothetical protein
MTAVRSPSAPTYSPAAEASTVRLAIDPGGDAAPTSSRRRAAAVLHTLTVLVALGLWAWSLPEIDLTRMSDIGLISVIPLPFFVGAGLLCVGFAVAAVRRAAHGVLLGYSLAMIVVLHAAVPVVFPTPHYPYVYKHVAVVRYILENGAIDRSVDIYHNWPGLFAACAILSELTGVDPIAYANWAEPFFALCGALGVYVVAKGFTADRRRAAATVWVYVLVSCASQTYLSPQSLGFFLALLAIGVAARVLRPMGERSWSVRISGFGRRRGVAIARPVLRLMPWLRRLRLLPEPPVATEAELEQLGTVSRRFAALLVLLLAAAVAVTHQLSPIFLLLLMGALVVLGRMGSWWLLIAVGLMTAAWIATSYSYLSLHFSLFNFNFAGNLQGTQSELPGAGSSGHQLVANAARVMMLLTGLTALLAWWSAGRNALVRPRQTFVWGLVIAPALVLAVQSYGGEAIYRVAMFALPFLAFLAAGAIVAHRIGGIVRGIVVAALSAVAAGLFVLNYNGLDSVNYVTPDEVAASAWFEENTPPGSVLGMLSGFWPTPVTAEYPTHLNVDGNWGAIVYTDPHFEGYVDRALTASDITPIIETMQSISRGPVYIGVGPTQRAAIETYGYAPAGSMDAFVEMLKADPRIRTVYSNGNSTIFLVLPVASQ